MNNRPLSYMEEDVQLPTLTPNLDAVLESKLSTRVKASPRRHQNEETSEVFKTYEGRNVKTLDK